MVVDDIFFKSPVHRECFLATMQEIRRIDNGHMDRDYAAAVYILTSSDHIWSVAKAFVLEPPIDFDKILEEGHWSGGPRRMIKLAGNLLGGQTDITYNELMGNVDEDNYRVSISAQHIRHYGLHVDNLK